MIERIRLVNFKSHVDTEVTLGRLTALIGPNSAGKTSVLEALYAVSRLLREDQFPKAWDRIHSYIRSGVDTGEMIVRIDRSTEPLNGTPDVTRFLDLRSKHKTSGHDEFIIRWAPAEDQIETETAGSLVLERDTKARYGDIPLNLVEDFGHARYFKAIGNALGSPAYSETVPPVLDSDGSGLASVVSYLKGNDLFAPVLNALRAVVPAVENVRVRPAKVTLREGRSITVNDQDVRYQEDREVTGQELVFDMAGGKSLPAHAISEGTLVALTILTLLHSPECPNLVLIDDIEQGLHPAAQRELIGQLRKLLEQRPGLQIVVTSHSPYIVDELEPDEVWVLAADQEGISYARRLSEHPEVEKWMSILSTGEFWDAQGEDWVLESEREEQTIQAL